MKKFKNQPSFCIPTFIQEYEYIETNTPRVPY